MQRVVGYLRVSDPNSAEKGYSLQEQEAAIRAHCDAHSLRLVEVVQDPGVTGRILDRPAVRRVRELAKAGLAEAVLLVRLDRMGRENRLIQNLLHEFRMLGLVALFVEHGGGDSPTGRFLLNVLGSVAELEWEQIREKTSAGRYGKAKTGKAPSGYAPFGYRLITVAEAEVLPEAQGRDGELEILPEEAEVVREIYRRVASGDSVRSVIIWLNERGTLNRRGNVWYVTTMRRLLQNPVYKGTRRYGHTHTRKNHEDLSRYGNPKTIRSRSETWIEMPCPAIVGAETWERVQEILALHAHTHRGRPTASWPLKGIVFCGICRCKDGTPRRCSGSAQKKKDGSIYRRYVCAGHLVHSREGCRTAHSAKKLEALARKVIERASQPGYLAKLYREQVRAQTKGMGEAEATLKRLVGELAKLDNEERRHADMIMAGISPRIVAEKMQGVQRRREALEAEFRQAQDRLLNHETPDAAAARGEAEAEQLREWLRRAEENPTELQRLYQQTLRITLERGKPPEIEVRWLSQAAK